MAFERAEDVLASLVAQGLRSIEKANPIHTPRPRMRNIDRRLVIAWRLVAPFLLVGVDKPKVRPRPDVIELIEWVVVSLIVGEEQFALAIAGEAHWEAMTGRKGLDVKQPRVVGRSLSRNKLEHLSAVPGRGLAALILLARQSDEILAVVTGNQPNGPVVVVVSDAPS